MAKYGRIASTKVARAMRERKQGTLRSGGSGRKVTSRKQAIAIGLSEAREAGGKVPARKGGSRKKTTGAGKSAGARQSAGRRRSTAGKKAAAPRRTTKATSRKRR